MAEFTFPDKVSDDPSLLGRLASKTLNLVNE
jgi:hypothetical protein